MSALSHYTSAYNDNGHTLCEMKTDAPPVLDEWTWIFDF
jgi:hypothetical protein